MPIIPQCECRMTDADSISKSLRYLTLAILSNTVTLGTVLWLVWSH